MSSHCKPAFLRTVFVALTLALAAATITSSFPPNTPNAASSAYIIALADLETAAAPEVPLNPLASLALVVDVTRAEYPRPLTGLPDLRELDTAAAPDATTTITASLPLTVEITTATGGSTLERAHARLQAEGLQTQLFIVSRASRGVELAIYRDLRIRYYRSTTGPDEGIDTYSLACYPACVFVPVQEINVLTVERWMAVLRHEYRHVIQARNNPNLASDFRGADGVFTSYGLFSEVCADYGLYVAPGYGARWRMGALKFALGASRQWLIDQACQGIKPSYDSMVQTYNRIRRSSRAFAALFPRYR
jgi:hypothetical protein